MKTFPKHYLTELGILPHFVRSEGYRKIIVGLKTITRECIPSLVRENIAVFSA